MIFLDAAGTLIEVRGSVGEVYAGVAASFGVEVPAAEINQAFARLLPAHLPMIVPPNLSPEAHQQAEFDWWKDLARKVFAPHLPIENFDALFETLFRTFERAEAWHVFSDVVPCAQSASATRNPTRSPLKLRLATADHSRSARSAAIL
jgi:putative hydrolase of the HAD superfamily